MESPSGETMELSPVRSEAQRRTVTNKVPSVGNSKTIAATQKQELQEEILQACKDANEIAVKDLVQQLNGIKLNCADKLGRSPLHIAVVRENEKMVEDLLPHSSEDDVQHCFLFATAGPFRKIAILFKNNVKDPESFPHAGDARYKLALVLSAEKNLYNAANQIEGILTQNVQYVSNKEGTQTQKMDFTACQTALCLCCQRGMANCDKGVNFLTPPDDDPLMVGLEHKQEDVAQKVHYLYYKGLANEAFLTLACEDPIMTSFQLREKLATKKNDTYFKDQYVELEETLSRYTARLLDYIRSDEEKDVILRGTPEDEFEFPEGYNRLRTALEKEEKHVAVL